MRLPLLSGILANETAEFQVSYPINLEIVATDNKIAKAQFRATSGAVTVGTGPGACRGGILWNDEMYRVMGTRLVKIAANGTLTDIGDVGSGGQIAIDFGFDRLAVASSGRLYYYNGASLTQVTDSDLGLVKDMIWISGYYMTTDGTSIVVTELSDPTQVKPLKYGSAEEDPDMVTGLIKLRNEAYAVGRYTIQVLRNVGGNGFPFANQEGATIPVGCVSASAKCLYADTFAFVGSARNEGLGVYLAGSGSATRISPRQIDDELALVADPSSIVVENRTSRGERRLFIHLPDKTLVFLANASKELSEGVWYIAQSGIEQPYRLRNAVRAYGKTYIGDAASGTYGELSGAVSTHFGEVAQQRCDVGLVYNEAHGGIIKSVELVGLPGRAPANTETVVMLSMTRDGETFSEERSVSLGARGERDQRMQWRPRTNFRNWIGLRFRIYGQAMPGIAACEAEIEPLA